MVLPLGSHLDILYKLGFFISSSMWIDILINSSAAVMFIGQLTWVS